MMPLLALPIGVPIPTADDRAVLRLALRGLYPPAIAARLLLDERDVDATLRKLAKAYLMIGHGAAVSEDALRPEVRVLSRH